MQIKYITIYGNEISFELTSELQEFYNEILNADSIHESERLRYGIRNPIPHKLNEEGHPVWTSDILVDPRWEYLQDAAMRQYVKYCELNGTPLPSLPIDQVAKYKFEQSIKSLLQKYELEENACYQHTDEPRIQFYNDIFLVRLSFVKFGMEFNTKIELEGIYSENYFDEMFAKFKIVCLGIDQIK